MQRRGRLIYVPHHPVQLLKERSFSPLFPQDDYVRTWDENQGSSDSKSLAHSVVNAVIQLLFLLGTVLTNIDGKHRTGISFSLYLLLPLLTAIVEVIRLWVVCAQFQSHSTITHI